MRLGLNTLVYNCERWIYPFLKLTTGLDRRLLVLGSKPFKGHAEEHGYCLVPDRTRQLVTKCFPDVEIIDQRADNFGCEALNIGHEYLAGDCDFILRLDSDEMILPPLWERLLTFLRSNNWDSLTFDFGKDAILYYDLDHGIRNPNPIWPEIRGLNKIHRYVNLGSFSGPTVTWEPEDLVIHHFTGLKRGEKDREWMESIKGQETAERWGDDGRWYVAPPVLRQLFEEGWKELENL